MLKKHRHLKRHICYVCGLLNHAYELSTIKTKFEMLVEMMAIHLSKGRTILFGRFINLWHKFILQNDYHIHCGQCYLFVRLVASQPDITNTMLSELDQYQTVYQLDMLEKKLKAVLNPKGSTHFQKTHSQEHTIQYEINNHFKNMF